MCNKMLFDILVNVIIQIRGSPFNMTSSTVTRLTHSDIKKLYTLGFKSKSDLKVGFEYERIPICSQTNMSVEYYGKRGICELLKTFAKQENWDYILDNDNIIGLKQGHDTITLEPGCQTEFSIEPQKNIFDLEKKVNTIDSQIMPMLDKMGILLLNYGVTPLSTNKTINLIPKKRYEIMAKYLWGILSDVMMRETAGVQGTFDFLNEEDAMKKFGIANLLSPFITAMFANSPIRGGVDTGYKSFRALSWLNTDNDRCGFFYNLLEDYDIDDYINYVLETPMLFINREGESIVISGDKCFSKFMEYGHAGFNATIDDYLLHANLCFPEVRLRNFIEVRNHDCNGSKLPYAMLALYKGILYSDDAVEQVKGLLKPVKKEVLNELRYNVPKYALQTKIFGYTVKDFAVEIINIAEYGLRNQFSDEIKYLDYIKEYTFSGNAPADIILKNWYGTWNRDINRFIKYITNK